MIQWTAPRSGGYVFDLDGSEFDTVLAIVTDCDGRELVCNDDCFGLQSAVQLNLRAGDTVLVVIDGFGGLTGDFALSILQSDRLECRDDGVGTVTFTDSAGSADSGGGGRSDPDRARSLRTSHWDRAKRRRSNARPQAMTVHKNCPAS